MFFRNKKGVALSMSMIIKIALLTLAFLMIIGLFTMLFARAEDKGSEELCHTFNLLLVRYDEDAEGQRAWGLLPQACQVLEVEDIPTSSYARNEQGAMKQIADLSARCWWMFLEGYPDYDVLGRQWRIFPGSGLGKDQCFICYTFDLNPGLEFDSITLSSFFDSKAYTVRDTSEKCQALGGGKCMAECSGDFSKKVESKKCGPGEICCAAKDECVNKGGKCMDSCSGEFSQQYDGWACSGERCCVDPDDYYTYKDYIQEFFGPGYLAVEEGLTFESGEQYAIIFNEDPKPLGYLEKKFQDLVYERKIDGIIITQLSNVGDRCAVQAGAGGK